MACELGLSNGYLFARPSRARVVGELLFCFGVTQCDIALNLDTVPIRKVHVGDELSVPGQQRIRFRDSCQFFQGLPSEPVGDLSQRSFFGIG